MSVDRAYTNDELIAWMREDPKAKALAEAVARWAKDRWYAEGAKDRQAEAREVAAADPLDDAPPLVADCGRYLRSVLADGPRLTLDVEAECDRLGHRPGTVERARRAAGVRSTKGPGGQWWLALPSGPRLPGKAR